MSDISFQDGDNFIRNAVTIRSASGRSLTYGRLRKVDAFGELPMPIADLMLDLAIDDDDFQATVERLARFSCNFMEKRTARVPIQSSYEWRCDAFWYGKLEIRRFPCRAITAFQYLPADAANGDAWEEIPEDQYWVVNQADSISIMLLASFTWPDLWQQQDSIRVLFDAGYDSENATDSGDGEFPFPDDMRTLVTMMTAHCYQHRELFEADRAADIEQGLGSILGAYSTYW